MINWMFTPSAKEVARYIDCYWFLEKSPASESYPYPKLNPDPAGHLILSPKEQTYHYGLSTGVFESKGSHLLFPHTQTFQLDHAKPFQHIGIKFQVGALYSVDIEPIKPALDDVVDIELDVLIGRNLFNEDALFRLAKKHPQQCCEALDKLLTHWLLKSLEDNHSQLTRRALPLLSDTPIAILGEKLGCSRRTLERSFRQVTGMTLKQCQSMNKLETMLAFLYQRGKDDIDWVEVAYQFDFSDQPHLIRYLKNVIGSTPNDYANKRDLTIDIYGGVETKVKPSFNPNV